jgi:hypothetical protein
MNLTPSKAVFEKKFKHSFKKSEIYRYSPVASSKNVMNEQKNSPNKNITYLCLWFQFQKQFEFQNDQIEVLMQAPS